MKRLLPTLLMMVLCCKASAQVSFGQATLLNDDWRFLRIDSMWNIAEHPSMKDANFNDSQWRTITLPHDWGVELPMSPDKGSCQGYLSGGIGWYRKSLSTQHMAISLPHREGQGVGLLLGGSAVGCFFSLFSLHPLQYDRPSPLFLLHHIRQRLAVFAEGVVSISLPAFHDDVAPIDSIGCQHFVGTPFAKLHLDHFSHHP